MSLYRVTPHRFERVPATTFAAERLLERRDLQRLLRENIEVLDKDLMVIGEEFGNWQDSTRRIDLLCLSRDGSLVVVEIKRTEDGGHMDLQAIRYAAMVSSLTMDRVVEAYAQSKGVEDRDAARREIAEFLQSDGDAPIELTGGVRIVLVSADFSVEVTTTVLWLNRQGLDLRCVRLRPYRSGSDVLVEATQIIPLPEAAEYEVKLRERDRQQRKASGPGAAVLGRFWTTLIERSESRTQLFQGVQPSSSNTLTIPTDVEGIQYCLRIYEADARVLCLIRLKTEGVKKRELVDGLYARRDELEAEAGCNLDWLAMESKQERRIRVLMEGGWKLGESEWPELQDRMIDALIRLETALRNPINKSFRPIPVP
ncbi:MAG: DUF4268 domain-containing protein [Verrucomicrobiae bacterium]|nr:DUF4268 domain-containing protein [Verrucomicrobiae bacterium]